MTALYHGKFLHPIKAITIRQPYAELIARGAMLVENRTWPINYRGDLAIHAAQRPHADLAGFSLAEAAALPRGAIVAVARVVDCVRVEKLRAQRSLYGDHSSALEFATGPWCWVLADVRRLAEPEAIAGRRSLWNVPSGICKRIAAHRNG